MDAEENSGPREALGEVLGLLPDSSRSSVPQMPIGALPARCPHDYFSKLWSPKLGEYKFWPVVRNFPQQKHLLKCKRKGRRKEKWKSGLINIQILNSISVVIQTH